MIIYKAYLCDDFIRELLGLNYILRKKYNFQLYMLYTNKDTDQVKRVFFDTHGFELNRHIYFASQSDLITIALIPLKLSKDIKGIRRIIKKTHRNYIPFDECTYLI